MIGAYKDDYYYHVEYVVEVSGNKVYAIGTSDGNADNQKHFCCL